MQFETAIPGGCEAVLTADATAFVADLHRRFDPTRRDLIAARAERQARLDADETPDFLTETAGIRAADWEVEPAPADLADRRVEITGPVDRKMIINALNSGARVFMADFEDSTSPTWDNVVRGQANLRDAVRRTISHEENGKEYRLGDRPATLMVRPRGWHLDERHARVDGAPVSASLFDFGLYFFHNHRELAARGTGPYFYLPKLESRLEARLWNDVFEYAQRRLGVARGTIKATVLVENILAAFEMDEILWELRSHSAGLNAGRWDYIFSIIRKFRTSPKHVLPDRAQVTMTVPFMRAYTELMVQTCHRRGAHAIGGMAAFIPNRRDAGVTERALAGVRADKQREAQDGCDGTWVAHPDLVPVAQEVFDEVLGGWPNQLGRQRPEVDVAASDLTDVEVPGGEVTEDGLRTNVRVGILYIESWLRGTGAAALFNLMEDAATAEISRSQVWQWLRHGAVARQQVLDVIDEEMAAIRDALGDERMAAGRFEDARKLFTDVAMGDPFTEFLTLPAYELLD